MTAATALLGTWKMVSWVREVVATGETIDALGPNPVGYLTYCRDGRMMTLEVGKERITPKGLVPTAEEKCALFDTMLAYAGTYTVDSEKVIHHVDVSWNQTWTDTDQVRFYQLDGDISVRRLPLTLTPAKRSSTASCFASCRVRTDTASGVALLSSSSCRHCTDHIVRRQGPPDTLERELTHRLDCHGIFDLRQHPRTNQDLPWLRFIERMWGPGGGAFSGGGPISRWGRISRRRPGRVRISGRRPGRVCITRCEHAA